MKDKFTKSATCTVQFFHGTSQRSSVDGKTIFGSNEVLICRIVDFKNGKITEIVCNDDELFIAELKKTSSPLVFSVRDSRGLYSGNITFSDSTLSAWSYDIDVHTPPGKITGVLPDAGAKIDPKTGAVEAIKTWNNQVRISESCKSISQEEYVRIFKRMIGTDPSIDFSSPCR